MNIAFVIGHHSGSKGAFSDFFLKSEFDFYIEVIKYLEHDIGKVNLFYHNPNVSSYTERIKETASKLNKFNFDLVIELHFNAATPQANGCETLYYFNSKKSKEFAHIFTDTVCSITGIKSRSTGVKALTNKRDRGFASVYYPKAPTILIEPFFGTNRKDCAKIVSCENMAFIIKDFLNQIK
tara:strand:+ start:263 stop:805 length:543 start_codon:yes stop_codon:yes gene_type:complete